MKKSKKRAKGNYGGPYLQVAALCERVIQEPDNAITVIRIVDTLTFTIPETRSAAAMEGGAYQVLAVVIFKDGSFKGKQILTIRGLSPDGKVFVNDILAPIPFKGKGETGSVGKIQMNIVFRMEGLHWFHVLLDGKRITRIPLRIVFKKTPSTSGSVPPNQT